MPGNYHFMNKGYSIVFTEELSQYFLMLETTVSIHVNMETRIANTSLLFSWTNKHSRDHSHDDEMTWRHFLHYWPFVRESTSHQWIALTKWVIKFIKLFQAAYSEVHVIHISPHKQPEIFYISFVPNMNKLLNKQFSCQWFEMLWCWFYVTQSL